MNKHTSTDAFGLGPLHEVSRAYLGQANGTSVEMGHAVRNMARWQLEMWGLASRRAQAYLELPGRLGQCRSADALQKEQARFLQKASQQYVESSTRMFQAWQSMMVMPMPAGAVPAQKPDLKKPDRDYIQVSSAPKPVAKPKINGHVSRSRKPAREVEVQASW